MAAAPLDTLRKRATDAQSSAADPVVSAWVSANAGTGKTQVLTMRVLRLLLAGTAPEAILCLTYTKAAAAEMAKRVFDRLSEWVVAAPEKLDSLLAKLLERQPTDGERQRARELFARTIETPGGLKVQTIHAFCERLLQQFPLEADVPPGFSVLDDAERQGLIAEAIERVLTEATKRRGTALARALDVVVPHVAEQGFEALVGEALSKRTWLEAASRIVLSESEDESAVERHYRKALGLAPDASDEAIEAGQARVLSDTALDRIASVLAGGKKMDGDAAQRASAARRAQLRGDRITALVELLLTKEGEPRSRLMTKDLAAANPDVLDLLVRAQGRLCALAEERRVLALADASAALTRIADRVMQHYTDGKRSRASLDFDDLIRRTASLLATESGSIGAPTASWIHYKLDGRIEHILVDEAQDTSPVQWELIEALADEFFSGEGAHGERRRTIFAVGDEKQSIYSFQGAAPAEFRRLGGKLAARARDAGLPWRRVPLTLSFRTVEPVLAAVDRVFSPGGADLGLAHGAETVRHLASRAGQAGLVEVWPTEVAEEAGDADIWSPLDEGTSTPPVARLATRIADRIERWLRAGERLPSQNRMVRAGDILILVRHRKPFAPAMVAALKARGIPVAGADRVTLTEQLAVMDLMALADFLVLPEDDLALAAVLKSPLIGLDDDDLMTFAPRRRGMLWSALLSAGKTVPRLAEAGETLKRWRARADVVPPYEFLAGLLGRDGGRERFIARLGPEAGEALDELLTQAIAYDSGEPPSLVGFLDALRRGHVEVKRDMEHGSDEVRVMTVHGAKGLEAPIVFLPDTCGSPSRRRANELIALAGAPGGDGLPPAELWVVKGTGRTTPVRDAKAALAAAETEEHNRLLYVALTRARDRLYVCGFEGKRGRAEGCWYDTVTGALDGLLAEADDDGMMVRRLAASQLAEHEEEQSLQTRVAPSETAPEWLSRPAPSEPQRLMPIAPSRLLPLEIDETGDPVEATATGEPSLPSPLLIAGESRFLRGTLTHALLEHLPMIAPGERRKAAEAVVEARGKALPARMRQSIVTETLAILDHPELGALFGPQSRAEVAIVAEIEPPDGRGPALRINGSIDRLAVTDVGVLILDYKTNRPAPRETASVPEAYLAQLAAYRLAARAIFGHEVVRAAIIWTELPHLMEIPVPLLDVAERRLWSAEQGKDRGP